jgi:hypothetical protein
VSMRTCCHLVSRRRASRIETRASKQACDDVVPSTGHRTWRRVGDASPARTLRKSQRVVATGRRGGCPEACQPAFAGTGWKRREAWPQRRQAHADGGGAAHFVHESEAVVHGPPAAPPAELHRISFFPTPRTGANGSVYRLEVREPNLARPIFEKLPLNGSSEANKDDSCCRPADASSQLLPWKIPVRNAARRTRKPRPRPNPFARARLLVDALPCPCDPRFCRRGCPSPACPCLG